MISQELLISVIGKVTLGNTCKHLHSNYFHSNSEGTVFLSIYSNNSDLLHLPHFHKFNYKQTDLMRGPWATSLTWVKVPIELQEAQG